MVLQLEVCRVHFPEWYDERAEWEAEQKGWLQGVEVELADGSRYPLYFYDPVRLAQDLEADPKHGGAVIAEPGMVIIAEVTRAAILHAVQELVRRPFFDHLKPITVPVANGVAH